MLLFVVNTLNISIICLNLLLFYEFFGLKAADNNLKEKQAEILSLREEIESRNKTISEHNKVIKENPEFVKQIENAVLPKSLSTFSMISDQFILFLPRDIASGDFYSYNNFDDILLITIADCSGQGVHSALMSVLGLNLLNEIIVGDGIKDPVVISYVFGHKLSKTLNQNLSEQTSIDAIHMTICAFDCSDRSMEYASANNSVILIRNGEIIQLQADKMPIGSHIKMHEKYSKKTIQLKNGDLIYLFSDGFSEQFGGKDGRKFKLENFVHLLMEIKELNMEEQKKILEEAFFEWKGKLAQGDDILVIGLLIGENE